MTWKNALQRAVKREMQPMRQATHWIIFTSCALIATMSIVTTASAASADLIKLNPEIAESSWLVK